MDVSRQQILGPVLGIIETLRQTVNILEAQVQALTPPSNQIQPSNIFQAYHPTPPVINQQYAPHHHQQQQQHQQQHQQMAPPASGGATMTVNRLKRDADGINDDASLVPIKKRRRRRRRNSAGELVDGDPSFENGHGHGGRGRRTKAPIDPNRPKRPASAYLIFQNEVRKDMQAAYPDKPYHEILGKISERWNALGEGEKKHYTDITVLQKIQYEKDKAKYEKEREGSGAPPSAGTTTVPATATSTGVEGIGSNLNSAGVLPPSAGATSEEADADEDEDGASEASAALQGHDEEEEEEEDDDEGEGEE